MNLKDTYNRIAEDWYKDHKSDSWWVEGTDAFVSFLPKGGSVLDVGCGAGVKSKYLSEKGLCVLGIDFSDKLIEIAKRDVPGVEFLVIDMKDAGTLEREFDGIFSQASLLHIPKKEVIAVLKGLASRLKKGGHLYIAVKEKWEGQDEEQVVVEEGYGYQYERFFSYFTKEELRGYLKELGMEAVFESATPMHKTTWLQIIGRK
ncbi:MAG: class I SAM-dependent methyltransferase [Parcubacteria group bacterium]|nr:class I SAM-dependent methyltransferase [Parcubacteria group bacterium]